MARTSKLCHVEVNSSEWKRYTRYKSACKRFIFNECTQEDFELVKSWIAEVESDPTRFMSTEEYIEKMYGIKGEDNK